MSSDLLSPEGDIFSTPPTTPAIPADDSSKHPRLVRRSSKPSSIHTEYSKAAWTPGVVLQLSPDQTRKANGSLSSNLSPPGCCSESASDEKTPQSHENGQEPASPRSHHRKSNVQSPCFIHSHLNRDPSIAVWGSQNAPQSISSILGVAPSLHPRPHNRQPNNAIFSMSDAAAHKTTQVKQSDAEDEEFEGSLTKQLADTAVGVREMSKQLGRARIRSNIQSVLIITKARDNRLIKLTRELALYLMLKPRFGSDRGLVVYVDHQLQHSKRFDAEAIEREHPELFVPCHRRRPSCSSLSSLPSSPSHNGEFVMKEEGQLRYWTSDMCSYSPHLFDFVVTLGGDGTVLFTSWLFQRIVPPVLSFALGSLGFLTNFDFADHQTVMDSVIDTGIRVNLRMRFTCTVYRSVAAEAGKGRKAVKKAETGEIMMKNVGKGGWEALEGGWSGHTTHEVGKGKDKEIMCFSTRPVETFEVLNDLVVDRGPSPFVSLLELFGDEHHMTTVQADGLTVSTPTGSTAYSLSAGGSLVHPEIPAILITPICPHTLSFRPMLLPDSMELRICVPFNSRSTAWASFDGRGRVELKQGDHIKVTASKYPFPTVCADKQSTDWFHAISRTLKWNERERQKSFVVVEEGPSKSQKVTRHRAPGSGTYKRLVRLPEPEEVAETIDDEEDEVSDEDEEEGKFDIDDLSHELETRVHKDSDRQPRLNKVKSPPGKGTSRRPRSRVRSGGDPLAVTDSHHRFPRLTTRHSDHGTYLSHGDSDSSAGSPPSAQHGARDDIHTSRAGLLSSRSKIPKDRKDVDYEIIYTPTATDLRDLRRSHHSHASASSSEHQPRAFAVWGVDESDSNASESENDLQD